MTTPKYAVPVREVTKSVLTLEKPKQPYESLLKQTKDVNIAKTVLEKLMQWDLKGTGV